MQVEQLAEHAKQLALSHRDTSVREKASHSLECAAQHYPHVARDTLLPALLQLFTLSQSLYCIVHYTVLDSIVYSAHIYISTYQSNSFFL